ncbi:hypothetical protein GK047_04340 [Paenibacillus sp. SYP-B3998]|uniref:Uncharacterized protein n=1 Tax=Paenibacillus sp. SYP-B3998 TaxID=2678564 RepID=A0A6G3ZUI2_9BACL|nr:hypothetical protein [Paenibacillus sp. SYP-B3998]NEW05249.1 hypothetical protein [Paenibacillus sp. SYP-B3998]
METKIGLLMDLPEGKAPGFYAQIIKALAGKVELFDRDKEMLIVNTPQQQQAVWDIMTHYHIETEIMHLRLLPDDAELTELFSDYGFISRSEHAYLYEKIICLFRVNQIGEQSDVKQALLQIQEHLLAEFSHQEQQVYIVDRQLEELMHGIAKAYRCQIEMLS